MDFLEQLKPILGWLHENTLWTGLLVFLISLCESLAIIGLIIPGSVMMTGIGTLVGAGIIPIWSTLIWAILGAIAGDSLSYRLGFHFNTHIREMWPFRRYPQILNTGERFFDKHGGKSVFLGRFVGPVRPIIPVVAGMMRLAPRRFFVSNVFSAILWAPFYMLPGMLLGAATLEMSPQAASQFLVLVVLVLIILWFTAWLIKRGVMRLHYAIDTSLNRLWRWMQNHRALRPFCRMLQDPRQPENHGQIGLALACVAALVLFLTLLVFVDLSTAIIVDVNSYVWHFFRNLSHPTVTNIMIGITTLGDRFVVTITAMFAVAYLLLTKRLRAAIHIGAALVLCGAIVTLCKEFIQFARPDGLLKVMENNAFPSGHVTGSITIFSFLAIVLTNEQSRWVKHSIYWITALLCFAIIISRLYLSAHWLTDVLGAVLLGLSISWGTTISYRRQISPQVSIIKLSAAILIGLVAGWSYFMIFHFEDYQRKYQAFWPSYTTTLENWWDKAATNPPQFHENRFGVPSQLFNLQFAVPILEIEQALLNNGWKEVPELTMFSAMQRLSMAESSEQLPLIPEVHNGKIPFLVFYKQMENEQLLMVLQIWNSGYRFTDSELPLWFATITYQMPRYKFWHYPYYRELSRKLPPATETVMPSLQNFEWKQVIYPDEKRPDDHIKRLDWRGGVLFAKPKDTTVSYNWGKYSMVTNATISK